MSEAYLSCPSAQPDQADARVIGVVTGDPSAPRIAYLDRDVFVTEADLVSVKGISPTRVLRFAGRCESSSCGQFRDGGCRLGRDIASMLTPAEQSPPASPDLVDVVEKAIDEIQGAETYSPAKDTGKEGPVHQCPSYERETLLEDGDRCAACGDPVDYDDECDRCGAGIGLAEYLAGADGSLCSYCAWQTEKAMRDD